MEHDVYKEQEGTASADGGRVYIVSGGGECGVCRAYDTKRGVCPTCRVVGGPRADDDEYASKV